MTVPRITGVELSGDPHLPLLIVGPSLGTSVTALWSDVADLLADSLHVVGWNLPGHAGGPPGGPFTVAELADGVRRFINGVLTSRADLGHDHVYSYAGVSVGGAVGLQLLLDAPAGMSLAALFATGARIGSPDEWAGRAAMVRSMGTSAVLSSSAQRWFAPGFLERMPEAGSRLLHALQGADAESYAQTCEALAAFDVRGRLDDIATPLVAVAGGDDVATPPDQLREIVRGVRRGELSVMDGVAHLPPAEAPDRVARLLRQHLRAPMNDSSMATRGEAIRRRTLGDRHVDRSTPTAFTADFHELITRYAWGTIWARPGLDRRSRSMITLTALIARGHHAELAMHVHAGLRNGLTTREIEEILLQSAIYCGVPDANNAFRVAQQAIDSFDSAPPVDAAPPVGAAEGSCQQAADRSDADQ